MFDILPGLLEEGSKRAHVVRRLSIGMSDLENRRGARHSRYE